MNKNESEQKKQTKRYFWLKLQTNFFNSQEIKVIQKQRTGEKYIIFWLKLLLLAIQQEVLGCLRFKDDIPYTPEILSDILDTDINVVRSALALFVKLSMIEIKDNGDILIELVLKMVGSESESARRVRAFRERKRLEEQKSLSLQCNVETELKLEKEKESNSSRLPSGERLPTTLKFLKELNPHQQAMLIKIESRSCRTIDEAVEYIFTYEKKTGKIVEDPGAFVFEALRNDWDLSGEDYQQWGAKQSRYEVDKIRG